MSDKPIFNYAHYEPGRHYGAGDFAVDESTVAKWRSVYPNDDDPGVMPAGMLAMIVIDKNIGPLLDLADRHYVLEKGRVVWHGGSDALRAQPEVLQRYLGV